MRNDIHSMGTIISNSFDKWVHKHSWIISTASLFVLQLITGFIVGIAAVIFVVMGVGVFLTGEFSLANLPLIIIGALILFAVLLLITVFIRNGAVRASIKFGRESRYQMEDFFTGFKNFGTVFVAELLIFLILFAASLPGAILTVALYFLNPFAAILGIIVTTIWPTIIQLQYSQVIFLINDKGLGAIAAMNHSKEIMKGYKLRYFGTLVLVSICTIVPLQLILIGFTVITGANSMAPVSIIANYLIMFVQMFVSAFLISIQGYFYCGLVDDDVEEASDCETTEIHVVDEMHAIETEEIDVDQDLYVEESDQVESEDEEGQE